MTAPAWRRRLGAWADELRALRHDLHRYPETAFEEVRTAATVARLLRRWGVETHEGIAGTGVVGVIRGGDGPMIGLRADMDALNMEEANAFAHRSEVPGKMHGCGHDGHTVMLLAAARLLAERPHFGGTAILIFQPAEEAEGGAQAMIDAGLFDRWPVDAVFALHNLPGLPIGHFALRSGPIMAGVEDFTIRIEGKGGHGGIPHKTIDPIPAIAEIVLACQTIVARAIDPLAAAVVSVTRLSAGASNNVVPDSAQIGGTFRYLDSATGDVIRSRLTALTRGVAAAHGVTGHFDCFDAYPPTVNSDAETAFCAATLRAFVGAERLDESTPPLMGAEDFSFMLNRRPGCYAFIGNGDGAGSCMIHNPRYDFNDASIPIGAEYFVRLVHAFCARSGR